jgi:hypothetical protein
VNEPIDRAALKREAEGTDGDRVVVSRAWLRRVHVELTILDTMRCGIEQVFGKADS